jgi:hypothetical protein
VLDVGCCDATSAPTAPVINVCDEMMLNTSDKEKRSALENQQT